MLNLKKERHLCYRLGYSMDELVEIADGASGYVEELQLIDPKSSKPPRHVINVTGKLRCLLNRIYKRLLLPALAPSEQSHGGVRGRHIRSNVEPHLKSGFAFTTDISSFYPGIHHRRVYRLFADALGCCPDVARILTRLCTYRHHLALGLPTSPILADQIMKPIDARICAVCRGQGLVYTRFVDDISISGSFDLGEKRAGIAKLIVEILSRHGFVVKKSKHKHGDLEKGFPITSLRLRAGRVDIGRQYVEDLDKQLQDAAVIAKGGEPDGLYFTQSQLRGRIEFASWINPSRRITLLRRLRSIDWNAVDANARRLGILSSKSRLVRTAE